MKPHVSAETSLPKDSARSVDGDKLHHLSKAISADASNQQRSNRLLSCNQRFTLQPEDPIRTLMFLASWSHT
ncbi:hypothetical protein PHAVU_001G205400 [Phaseolus vulgaris]|uniref:Uncharacterized protein n=1 Tax=Phaseolus vulgaris TaxID=3885 RepID=V7D0P5_PHAVU|nr:hypothetical protein PHAVU_001G205400g [Phaseolus vulgaris]ESW35085.1 hypothetical protein PHAVU_001G205400g [Phaseolus vulgaris]